MKLCKRHRRAGKFRVVFSVVIKIKRYSAILQINDAETPELGRDQCYSSASSKALVSNYISPNIL